MRLSTYDKPRIIACAEELPQHIALPRGCLEAVQDLLSKLSIEAEILDKRFAGKPLDVTFHGQLRPEQQAAACELLAHDTGVLSATTAFGKTVVATWLIAQRSVNTLVLVHRRQLMDQWVERLSTFLELPAKEIGRIGGGKKKVTGKLDVAVIQSLVRKGVVKDLVGDYGHLIVDECHHLSAQSFELVARRAKAKYVTGLSATRHPQGWAPSDHLHAMWSGAAPSGRQGSGSQPAVPAHGARSSHVVPSSGGSGPRQTDPVPGSLSGVDCR